MKQEPLPTIEEGNTTPLPDVSDETLIAASTEPTAAPSLPQKNFGWDYSDANLGKDPRRTANADRALAIRVARTDLTKAKDFLDRAFKAAIEATNGEVGGSTLSAVMAVEDDKYVCAHMGDSPIFLVMRNEITGEVRLLNCIIPDNYAGWLLHKEQRKNPTIKTLADLDETIRKWSIIVDEQKPPYNEFRSDKVSSHLGQMEKPLDPRMQRITHSIIDPQKSDLGPDFVYDGVMVCSDGVREGVHNGEVEKALTELMRKSDTLNPGEISRTVVETAKEWGTDNVTAIFMPAALKNAGLIAVADNAGNTATVAEKALEVVQQTAQKEWPNVRQTATKDRSAKGK